MISLKSCLHLPITLIIGIILIGFLFNGHIQARAQKNIIDSTDPAQRLKWFEQHTAMKNTSLFKDLEWRFLGPDIISGRITDIAVPK